MYSYRPKHVTLKMPLLYSKPMHDRRYRVHNNATDFEMSTT